jgi:hypothetical protein
MSSNGDAMEERSARWVAHSFKALAFHANQTPTEPRGPAPKSLVEVKNLRDADKACATTP